MRCVVIGGSGHIGTYLVPLLVEAGYEVHNISRGETKPYIENSAWKKVTHHSCDRKAEDELGTFPQRVRSLQAQIVIDLICFDLASAKKLVEAIRGQVKHFLHCGTIWVHGCSTVVPATEDLPRRPIDDYGAKKAQIETFLLNVARSEGFPATIIHPGHIVGPGYPPLNPAGHFHPRVFSQIAKGERVYLPNLGMETLHHVHAFDVARAFMGAINHWSFSVGENFHAVSEGAVTLRGYAEAVASWFNREANLEFLPWPEWAKTVSMQEAAATHEHILHSPNASIVKARRLIQYQPRFSSFEAIREAVHSLIADGRIQV
jgi:nucleoside-diphosphate-sugar epimerase